MELTGNNSLLRVEGVNLSSVLDDTSQISIRRGSGLLLRDAITQLAKMTELESISTGASVGLFDFDASKHPNLKQTVVNKLIDNYPYFTFVVDTEAYNDNDFKQAHETLIAKNRYRQFQQMTLVAPEAIDGANKICEMNFLHPADNQGAVNKKANVSASCRYRFEQGRKLRKDFYKEEVPQKIDFDFTDNLEALAKPDDKTQNFSNLNNKIALIYLDGNGFGKIQKNCKDKTELQAFDKTNQTYRREFLSQLITDVTADSDMENEKGEIRLETLLWGGDEMIIVVPAWKGMKVIQCFYEQSKDWHFNNNALSYAGGIVFCQHNTPVSQIIKAAKDLAESVKDSQGGREQAMFDYLVLESIDYPTQEINEYWALRYGKQTKKNISPLMPKDLPPDLNEVLEQLPRGSIYDIGQHWIAHWKDTARQDNDQLSNRIKRFIDVDKDAYNSLFDKVFPYLTDQLDRDVTKQHNNPAWLHLVELWDYLAPVNSKSGGQ